MRRRLAGCSAEGTEEGLEAEAGTEPVCGFFLEPQGRPGPLQVSVKVVAAWGAAAVDVGDDGSALGRSADMSGDRLAVRWPGST